MPSRNAAPHGTLTRRDEPAFVRQHDCLGAIAQIELRQHLSDMGLDGLLGDEQPLGDLDVGQSAGDQFEDLALTRGQGVQRFAPCARAARRLVTSAIRRRVTVGASKACPSATTRTARISSSAGAS